MRRALVIGVWSLALLAASVALGESLGAFAAIVAMGLVGYDVYMAFFYERTPEEHRG